MARRGPSRAVVLSIAAALLIGASAFVIDAAVRSSFFGRIGPQPDGTGITPNHWILTPAGVQRHIVSFRGKAGQSVESILDLARFPGKYFPGLDVARLSFHSDQLPGWDPDALEQRASEILLESSVRRSL